MLLFALIYLSRATLWSRRLFHASEFKLEIFRFLSFCFSCSSESFFPLCATSRFWFFSFTAMVLPLSNALCLNNPFYVKRSFKINSHDSVHSNRYYMYFKVVSWRHQLQNYTLFHITSCKNLGDITLICTCIYWLR